MKNSKLREKKVTDQSDTGMVHSKDLIQSLTPKPIFFAPNHFCGLSNISSYYARG